VVRGLDEAALAECKAKLSCIEPVQPTIVVTGSTGAAAFGVAGVGGAQLCNYRSNENQADRLIMAKPTTNRVIFESKLELITFTLDGHLLHTHKTNFVQRHSLDTWPDFESAKKAFESGPGQIIWGDPE
jgi:hypothetical protein